MAWIDQLIAPLAAKRAWGYHGDTPLASEPAALTALALLAHQRASEAAPALEFLLNVQSADGSVGVTAQDATPAWTTSQAVLAWSEAQRQPQFAGQFQNAIDRGLHWLLTNAGIAAEPGPHMGHDTTIIGWSWAAATHSWVEPTSWAVLALKATGRADHPRTREAVRLLIDRLLPDGGANYGNTFVLGQKLRPHPQPTGICLAALAGETQNDPRVEQAIRYLEGELSAQTTTVSLTSGLLGLTAQRRRPDQADAFLAAAAQRTKSRQPGAYQWALLALAAVSAACPLIRTNPPSGAA